MRKLLFVLFAALFLVACGSNEETQPEEIPVTTEEEVETVERDEAESEVETQTDEQGFLAETDDPVEAGNKTNGIEVFNDEWGYTYLIKDWYTNEATDEQGFNHIEFEGYEVNFSMTLLEDTAGNELIGVFAEAVNNTEETVQYNMDMEIITDQQEQASKDMIYGIGESESGIKTKGFVYVPLEYDTPNSFTVTLEPPFKKVGEGQYMEGRFGESIELEFNIE